MWCRLGGQQGWRVVHRWWGDAKDRWSARTYCYSDWFTGNINQLATSTLLSNCRCVTGALRRRPATHIRLLHSSVTACIVCSSDQRPAPATAVPSVAILAPISWIDILLFVVKWAVVWVYDYDPATFLNFNIRLNFCNVLCAVFTDCS